MKRFLALITSMFYMAFYVIYVVHNQISNGELMNKLIDKTDSVKGIDKVMAAKFLEICNNHNLYIVHKPNGLATIVAVIAFVTIGVVFFQMHQETHYRLGHIDKKQDEYQEQNLENHEATQDYLIDQTIKEIDAAEEDYEQKIISEE